MTTATATAMKEELDLERMHPVWSAKYGIETATTGLKKLAQTEEALAEQRMAIIKAGGQTPADEKKLENLEREIGRLQTRQRREQDKIAALTAELPGVRKEAEAQRDKLTELKKQLPKVSLEVESVNAELASLLNAKLVEQLIDLMEKRNRVAEELREIPYLISDVRSYFHLLPGVERVDAPELPEHIRTLIEALSK